MRMKSLKILFFLILTFCYTVSIAQIVKDPLKKPSIWQQLETSPDNNSLWEKYYGKSLAQMSTSEKTQMQGLQTYLMKLESIAQARLVADNKLSSGGISDWNEADPQLQQARIEYKTEQEAQKAAYHSHLETFIFQEPATLTSLKSNISENFLLIEEFYDNEFPKYGLKYIPYTDAYPEKKYPLEHWVKDQDAKLLVAKKERYEQLKAKAKNH